MQKTLNRKNFIDVNATIKLMQYKTIVGNNLV